MNSNILSCKHVSKSFTRNKQQVAVLKDINFSLKAGEIVVIRGQSGAGKSVLISVLAGLLRPDSGIINFKDFQIDNLSTSELAKLRLNEIGVVFQSHNLLSSRTALENVMVRSFGENGKASSHQKQAMEILTRLGLSSRVDHFPFEMSLGEQQRVAIARLLMAAPRLILADEPTGDVDPATAAEIIRLLLDIVKKNQAGMVITTHGHFPLEIAHQVFELKDGQLCES